MTSVPSSGDFSPTLADVEGVMAWFRRYDELTDAKDTAAMADQAMFPINEVTDGRAESCDRERFVAQMNEQFSASGDFSFESVRTPHFINENLVFVITNATMTVGEASQRVRYGDLLVKESGGEWRFQTMVQGGWG